MFEKFKSLFRPTQTSDARGRLFEPMESRRFLSVTGTSTPEPEPTPTDPVVVEPEEPVEEEPANPGLNDGDAFRDRMRERLEHEEGVRSKAYKDTKGKWTIGIGHNIDDNPGVLEDVTGVTAEEAKNGKELTEAQINALFEHDYERLRQKALAEVPNLADLDPTVQEAVADFVFNNGSMANFPSMRTALRAGDYREAAWQMSHKTGDRDSAKSDYFTALEPNPETGYPGNDRARVNIKALNDAANAAGQPPKFGWWNDVDDEDPDA